MASKAHNLKQNSQAEAHKERDVLFIYSLFPPRTKTKLKI